MQNKVQIVPDELGNVIRVSQNNSEFGHVRLEQDRVSYTNSGWVDRKVVTTLLHGKTEDLREMDLHNKTELNGKIIVKESLTPFNDKDPDRDLKIAGSTGIICCQDGQPIYRKTMYTPDVNAEDTLITHDNGDAIREANGSKIETKLNVFKVKANVNTTSKQIDLEDSIAEIKNSEEFTEEFTEEIVEELELEDSTFEL
jgi:hypothetical protein